MEEVYRLGVEIFCSYQSKATYRFVHLEKLSLNFLRSSFVIRVNLPHSSVITILVSGLYIIISFLFFHPSKLLFSGLRQFKGYSARGQSKSK